MADIPTPHITAGKDDFAETVLMPGDPNRSAFIAENFLDDPVLVNNIRGVQGYTGGYKGKKVSVMASGMGMPSIGIYSYELFNFYDVQNIIRIGTAGSISPKASIGDLVIGMGACTDSDYMSQFELPGTFAPICSYGLLRKAADTAGGYGFKYVVGNLYSTDVFYRGGDVNERWARMGVVAVEMESAALYANAARAGKDAICICSISDELLTGKRLSAKERETGFTAMMKVALDIA